MSNLQSTNERQDDNDTMIVSGDQIRKVKSVEVGVVNLEYFNPRELKAIELTESLNYKDWIIAQVGAKLDSGVASGMITRENFFHYALVYETVFRSHYPEKDHS